ncbi:hypothetical protein GCM10007094_39710 [Pseudovibrio japonicus]|uniref:PhoP regulatory network protein YrbL n=1 Tax=Pseudovibrio japonicus TaxID=366534 RepID=A0ABQ3EPH0_9HYPH|nr:YrbL family protein [Pseudovibrio japonicus]GHB46459.1 hypothetical protein GCM10007094_39710 [Pseudovibrio japonicus]
MIVLNQDQFIAAGALREVYVHPEFHDRCIKVEKNHGGEGGAATLAEIVYFEYLKKTRRQQRFGAIASYHGVVVTSRGLGTVFDLVRDEETGKTSRTLYSEMCKQHNDVEKERHERELRAFKHRLLKDAVLVTDLSPWNICVQRLKGGQIRYFLIDGSGHPNALRYNRFRIFIKMFRQLSHRKLTSYNVLKTYCVDYELSKIHWRGVEE